MRGMAAAAGAMVLFCANLRADFAYQIRTEMAGGKSASALRLIKGKRIAIVTRQRDTVIDLEHATLLEIDFHAKTFRWTGFPPKPEIKAPEFKIATRRGGRKEAGILVATEQVVTMTSAAPDLARIFLDQWTLTIPGIEEAQQFLLRLAAKFGYAYALGIGDLADEKPELRPGFEKAAEVLLEAQEMPVAAILRIGKAGDGDLAPGEQAREGIVAGALGRVEKMAHLKKDRSAEEQDPAVLADVRITLSDFGGGPADETKFNPPGGFKEIKPAK
jgi:hypothetical protein